MPVMTSPDLSRFSVEYDEEEYAYAVGPPGRPGRYLGITLICFDCPDDDEAGRMAARDGHGDVADLAVLNALAADHWARHHAPPSPQTES